MQSDQINPGLGDCSACPIKLQGRPSGLFRVVQTTTVFSSRRSAFIGVAEYYVNRRKTAIGRKTIDTVSEIQRFYDRQRFRFYSYWSKDYPRVRLGGGGLPRGSRRAIARLRRRKGEADRQCMCGGRYIAVRKWVEAHGARGYFRINHAGGRSGDKCVALTATMDPIGKRNLALCSSNFVQFGR